MPTPHDIGRSHAHRKEMDAKDRRIRQLEAENAQLRQRLLEQANRMTGTGR